jgi:hypothetical protein
MSGNSQVRADEGGHEHYCRIAVCHPTGIWLGSATLSSLEEIFVVLDDDRRSSQLRAGDSIIIQLHSEELGQVSTPAEILPFPISESFPNRISVKALPNPNNGSLQFMRFQKSLPGLRPVILVVSAEDRISEIEFPEYRVEEVVNIGDAESSLDRNEVAAIIFGPEIEPPEIRRILDRQRPNRRIPSVNIGLYSNTASAAFQSLIDDNLVFYIAHTSIESKELSATVAAGLRSYRQPQRLSTSSILKVEENDRLADLCVSLTRSRNLLGIGRSLSQLLEDILEGTRSRFLFYDSSAETLHDGAGEHYLEPISAASGLVGYVARTGTVVALISAGGDSRFDAEADNPSGAAEDHFLALPLKSTDGTLIGVLTGTRAIHLSPFVLSEVTYISSHLERTAPLLQILIAKFQIRESRADRNEDQQIFRQEALEYQNEMGTDGKLLRGIPPWLASSHLLIVLFLVIGIGYVSLAKVHQVANGPAIIRNANKISVPALSSGIVSKLLVEPGTSVIEGQLLATLQGSPGDSLLARMREEVRSPTDGIVGDISIHVGQAVAAGEQVLSLSGPGSGNEVIALLPGSFAPEVYPGMQLVLKIDGYPQSREELTIMEVEPEVFGPNDAARFVGKEIAQTLSLTGPILLVRSSLPQNTFVAASEKFTYHDGMVAQAEVSVRKEPLITALEPGLKELYSDRRIDLGEKKSRGALAGETK